MLKTLNLFQTNLRGSSTKANVGTIIATSEGVLYEGLKYDKLTPKFYSKYTFTRSKFIINILIHILPFWYQSKKLILWHGGNFAFLLWVKEKSHISTWKLHKDTL